MRTRPFDPHARTLPGLDSPSWGSGWECFGRIRGLHRNDVVMAAKTDSILAEWEGKGEQEPAAPIAKPERTQPR
jgi:hypothetical protein